MRKGVYPEDGRPNKWWQITLENTALSDMFVAHLLSGIRQKREERKEQERRKRGRKIPKKPRKIIAAIPFSHSKRGQF